MLRLHFDIPSPSVGGLPKDLAGRIEQAVASFAGGERTGEDLAAQATLAVEVAARFAGHSEFIDQLVEATDYSFDEWALNLPMDLAREGMVDEALLVADALAGADERFAHDYAADAARVLVLAGRAEEARQRIAENLSRFGHIPYTWMASGEALAELGDVAGATDAYDRAVEIAEDRDDPTEASDAHEHLQLFLQEHPGAPTRSRGPRTTIRVLEAPGSRSVLRATTTVGVEEDKVARNAPCPCGSGRKYKRCCGSPR